MKKIAIFLGALGYGGIESCVVNQFLCMYNKGFEFYFLVDSSDVIYNKEYEKIIQAHGGKIVPVQKETGGGLKRALCIYKLFLRYKFATVHFHFSYPSSLLYTVIARLAFVHNIVVTSHSKGSVVSRSLMFVFLQKMAKCILPIFCNSRIAVSDEAGHWLFGMYSFVTIFNGIDFEKFQYRDDKRIRIREKLNICDNTFIIGHIGRFEEDKNHKFIVDFFNHFCHQNNNAALLLIGNGSLYDKVKEYCISLGLIEKIYFINYAPNPEDYLCAMDLFVFPSLNEGFGLVAIEAQACALPVISSTNVPQSTKISSNIEYIPLDRPLQEWYNRSLILVSNNNRNSISLQNKIDSTYNIENVVSKIISYY